MVDPHIWQCKFLYLHLSYQLIHLCRYFQNQLEIRFRFFPLHAENVLLDFPLFQAEKFPLNHVYLLHFLCEQGVIFICSKSVIFIFFNYADAFFRVITLGLFGQAFRSDVDVFMCIGATLFYTMRMYWELCLAYGKN